MMAWSVALEGVPLLWPFSPAAVIVACLFIELYSSGYDQTPYRDKILEMADRYHLRCIAASDAPKPWHADC